MRKLLAVLFGLLMALAPLGINPAVAAETHYPDDAWEVRDVTCDPYPVCEWDPADESTIIDEFTVVLEKPSGNIGTSIETTDLNLTVDVDTEMIVQYSLSAGASFDAGAIRMFYYDSPDQNTILDVPTDSVAAGGPEGSLIINVPAYTTIGTMGLTYDASNNSAGNVTFANLYVGDVAILFLEPAAPPTTAPPTPDPTTPAAPSPSDSAIPTPTTAPGGLPVTGARVSLIAAGGLTLLAGGAVLYLLGRRRNAHLDGELPSG